MAGQLMISCRVTTELIEKKHRARLSWRESIQLPLHLAICDACRQYQVQSRLLEKLFKTKRRNDDAYCLPPLLTENAERLERQILQKLEKQQGLSEGQ